MGINIMKSDDVDPDFHEGRILFSSKNGSGSGSTSPGSTTLPCTYIEHFWFWSHVQIGRKKTGIRKR